MEIEARRFETGIPGFLIQGVLGPLEFHRVDGHQTSHQRCGSLGLPSSVGFPIFTHLRPGSTIANASAPPSFQKVRPGTRTQMRKNQDTDTVRSVHRPEPLVRSLAAIDAVVMDRRARPCREVV